MLRARARRPRNSASRLSRYVLRAQLRGFLRGRRARSAAPRASRSARSSASRSTNPASSPSTAASTPVRRRWTSVALEG